MENPHVSRRSTGLRTKRNRPPKEVSGPSNDTERVLSDLQNLELDGDLVRNWLLTTLAIYLWDRGRRIGVKRVNILPGFSYF